MKPIDSKDLPKVIGLGVATVGMLGFFAMTLMGAASKKGNPAPQPAPNVAAAPTTGVGVAPATPGGPAISTTTFALNDRMVELGGPAEPFRKVLPEAGAVDPFPKVRLSRRPSGLGGRLRGAPIPVGDFGGRVGGNVVGGVAPAQITEPTVRLDGVVTDGHPYAMITCGSRTDMFRVGARFGGVFEVVGINETGASFRGPKGIFRLEVGDEHVPTPAAPAPADTGSRLMEGNVEQVASTGAPILPVVGR